MLSNAYFLAKFRFDTAENEPAKNLQNFRKMHVRKMHFRKMHFRKMQFSSGQGPERLARQLAAGGTRHPSRSRCSFRPCCALSVDSQLADREKVPHLGANNMLIMLNVSENISNVH